MASKRIKLTWGMPRSYKAEWKFGLFGFYDSRMAGKSKGIVVSLRGVISWLSMLGLVGYLAGMGVIWSILSKHAYNYVTYPDLVLYPIRYKEVRKKRGEADIAEAYDFLKAKEYSKAFGKLKSGLSRNPGNYKARLDLGSMYLASNMVPVGQKIILQGLDYGYPGLPYLKAAIEVAGSSEDYATVVAVVDRALGMLPSDGPTGDRKTLVEAKLKALLAMERIDDALAFAKREGMSESFDIKKIAIEKMIKEKHFNQALLTLDEIKRQPDANLFSILPLYVTVYRESGDLDSMTKTLDYMRQLAPQQSESFIYTIIQYLQANQREEARRFYDNFMLQFGASLKDMKLLAVALRDINESELFDELYQRMSDESMVDNEVRMIRLESLIKRADWPLATVAIQDLRSNLDAKKDAKSMAVIEVASLLVKAASDPGQAAQDDLVNNLRDKPIPLKLYKQIIASLMQAKRIDTARKVVGFAQGAYPQSPYLKEVLVSTEDTLQAREEAEAAEQARQNLFYTSVDSFVRKLKQLQAEKKWDEASQLITTAKKKKPDWLRQNLATIDFEDIRINALSENLLRLEVAVGNYLGDKDSSDALVLATARDFYDSGHKDAAVTMMKSLVRSRPEYALASDLLQKWQPDYKGLEIPNIPMPTSEEQKKSSAEIDLILSQKVSYKNDQELMASIKSMLEAERYDDIHRNIVRVRRDRPAWLNGILDQVALIDIKALSHQDEPLILGSSVRSYLNGEKLRLAQCLDVARKANAAGKSENARMILGEILKQQSDYAPAQQLLHEIETGSQ